MSGVKKCLGCRCTFVYLGRGVPTGWFSAGRRRTVSGFGGGRVLGRFLHGWGGVGVVGFLLLHGSGIMPGGGRWLVADRRLGQRGPGVYACVCVAGLRDGRGCVCLCRSLVRCAALVASAACLPSDRRAVHSQRLLMLSCLHYCLLAAAIRVLFLARSRAFLLQRGSPAAPLSPCCCKQARV